MKKYAAPILMLAIFETIAVTLWLTKGNIFYLFNFSKSQTESFISIVLNPIPQRIKFAHFFVKPFFSLSYLLFVFIKYFPNCKCTFA